MNPDPWNERRMTADAMWQLYHENSKASRFERPLDSASLSAWQRRLLPNLRYDGHPAIELPAPRSTFAKSLECTLLERATSSALVRQPLALEMVATLLHYSYGITRRNAEGMMPRGFRAVPSAGALYPLELYVHAAAVDGLPAGLYHFEPDAFVLRRFLDGDRTPAIAERVAQEAIVTEASVVIFITALFERTTTKYGERGYRFALLEAGHVGQNLALTACALDLGAMNIGGFHDRRIDELLEIDGVNHSTLYCFALGARE